MNIVFVCQSGYVNQHVTSIPHLHTVTVTCSRKQNYANRKQQTHTARGHMTTKKFVFPIKRLILCFCV